MFLGMDASLFNVDMLRKICSKIGFTSRKFTKAVCHETIIKAVSDGKLYDSVDPTSSSTVNDSTGLRCRLLNVLMSDAFVTRLQLLGSQSRRTYILFQNKGYKFSQDFFPTISLCQSGKSLDKVQTLQSRQ